MSRFTGRSGEKRFSTLCSDAGITCNEPREDDHGWDHVVEIPHVPEAGVSADLQRSLPAIFVQTKSHEAEGLKVTMKLSNAVKLARSPNPCFVVLASLDAERRSTGWHAVHFWVVLAGRALKRARQASRDGVDEADFNDLSFSFTMTAADAHEDCDLLPWIAATVQAAGPDYAAAKAALHPGENVVGNLSIGPLASIDELVEHALGLTPDIPLKTLALSTRRFDVDLPMSLPDGDATSVTLHAQPADRCLIRMRGPDGLEIELEGDVIVPQIPGLADDHLKCRLRTDIVDIVWAPSGEARITGHISGDRRQSPADLERMLRMASWAGQGQIDVRVSVGDDPLLGAAAAMDELEGREDLAYLAELAGPLVRVSRGLRTRVPAISLDELGRCEGAEGFHSFLTATEMRSSTTLADETPLPDVDAGVAFGAIQVGDWAFAAIQRFPIARQTRADGMWRIEFGPPVLLEGHAFEVGDPTGIVRLKADYVRLAGAPRTLPLEDALAGLKRGASSPAG